MSPAIDERPPRPLSPLRLACWAAAAKARLVSARFPSRVVLAADTVVALDGRSFGKPESELDGIGILKALSGRTHVVYTAVAIVDSPRHLLRQGYSRTLVTMRELSLPAIASYVATGEAQDKAGAYAIQGEGRRLVAGVRGPFDNVVGMPMHLVQRLLRECGIEIPTKNVERAQRKDGTPRPPREAGARRLSAAPRSADTGSLRSGGGITSHDQAKHRRRQRA